MNNLRKLRSTRVACAVGIAMLVLSTAGSASANPVKLRCSYLQNPLGIDIPAPQLSWQSDNTERNWRQNAYEILVATDLKLLVPGKANVWDSGKQASAESVGISYGGPVLKATTRYFWVVRVWDANGKASAWSAPAWWETGFLTQTGWSAKWIYWMNPEDAADRAAIKWIWAADHDRLDVPAKTSVTFHRDFELAALPANAAFFVYFPGSFTVTVNGHFAGKKTDWSSFDRIDVASDLVTGKNSIEVKATVTSVPMMMKRSPGKKNRAAGLAALLKISKMDGSVERIGTDTSWQVQLADDAQPKSAAAVADLDDSRMDATPGRLPQPAALLRKDFSVMKPLASARLYVTALGSYRAYLNGSPVGQSVLTPGFTDYNKRVLYQVYDLTSSVAEGDNTIGTMLGDGWFGSGLTWVGEHFFTGPDRLRAQLELIYKDGTRSTISSDESWTASQSPILHSQIYDGEDYDARLEQAGWSGRGFNASKWSPAKVATDDGGQITSQIDVPPQVTEEVSAQTVTPMPDGTSVFDMGQNMVGWTRLKVAGARGTRIKLRFAERLNPDGSIYTENLRNASATDVYVLNGRGTETFSPSFTFHGFRYVEMTGYPGKPPLDAITGEVVSSVSGEPTAKLSTSSELLNHMWSIGIWGQRGNFLSVPTDCPQRDERLGWMGDAGVFWRTGAYNFDVAAFSDKWMNDVADAQNTQGAFTNVSPDTLPGLARGAIGAPGWADAGVIVPYTTWLQYGDLSIIGDHWAAMQAYMAFILKNNPDFLRAKGDGFDFADWLAPDQHTSKPLIDTAYWALSAQMMSRMAAAIGKPDDAKKYDELYLNIRGAFEKAYIKDNGEVLSGTQAAYVLALYAKMAPESLEPVLAENLTKAIAANNGHLSTGFLATPFILFALADNGHTDIAYQLLLNETYPSWGYMLSKGATTWWERWNGDTGDPAMNSYNHYAFGSVVAWAYRNVAGIDTSVSSPAFHLIVIHPRLDDRITQAHGEYESAYGKIVSDWKGKKSGPFTLNVVIPANTRAKVYLPNVPGRKILERGKPVEGTPEKDADVTEVGSGSYTFEIQ
ncbi:MAG: family 78 glycoside hydrolase catalytic domain [Candidatus Acidiferrales bacterium]